MKLQKFIFPILFGAVLVACSPRVDDIFDDTAVVRLENRRQAIMQQLMSAPNGWEMQYFAQSDPTASDPEKHQGYNFTMLFRNDGTVTVGAMVDGVFKTETSMWDVINDNSNVLTFNTFNSIFHYYSNPDPDLGLWGADGEGLGGDYEFLVLEYNAKENYQLLKGKKNGCYIRMYPLPTDKTWEDYFAEVDAMDKFLFDEQATLELYDNNIHLTMYNGYLHEFRVFNYDADTLGGGTYFGFIANTQGIYINGGDFHLMVTTYMENEDGTKTVLETHDTIVSMPREAFVLNEDKSRLVCATHPEMYITVDAAGVFMAPKSMLKVNMKRVPDAITTAEAQVNANISAILAKSAIASYAWQPAGDGRFELRVYYSLGGKAAKDYDIYYFTAERVGRHSIRLTYDGTYAERSQLQGYGTLDLVPLFNGTYDFVLNKPFAPSYGVMATRQSGDLVMEMTY